jgi:uncharacterized membrane protein
VNAGLDFLICNLIVINMSDPTVQKQSVKPTDNRTKSALPSATQEKTLFLVLSPLATSVSILDFFICIIKWQMKGFQKTELSLVQKQKLQ